MNPKPITISVRLSAEEYAHLRAAVQREQHKLGGYRLTTTAFVRCAIEARVVAVLTTPSS